MNQPEGIWHRIVAPDDVPEGQMLGVQIDAARIAIYKVDGEFFATDNVCTHAFAILSDGWLEGEVIECPLHGGRFDVRTGKALGLPVECDLRTYAVRVRDDHVEVQVPVGEMAPAAGP